MGHTTLMVALIGTVLVAGARTPGQMQTIISSSGMGVTISVPDTPRMRRDFGWNDATITGCHAVLKWSLGIHVAGDDRGVRGLTPYSAQVALADLRDLAIEQKSDPLLPLVEYVTFTIAVKDGRPQLRIDRGEGPTVSRERVWEYVFTAAAGRGRPFAQRLQAEIARCAARH